MQTHEPSPQLPMRVKPHASSDTPAMLKLRAAASSLTVLMLSGCGGTSETATTSPTAATTRLANEPERRGAREASFAHACPRALDPGPRAPEGVLRALRQAVPRTWHYTTMDGPLKLSAENTLVLDLRSLGSDSPNARGFSSRCGKLARRECGSTVTQRSWLALVYFPTSQAADLAERFALFARTAEGWKLWYHD